MKEYIYIFWAIFEYIAVWNLVYLLAELNRRDKIFFILVVNYK